MEKLTVFNQQDFFNRLFAKVEDENLPDIGFVESDFENQSLNYRFENSLQYKTININKL